MDRNINSVIIRIWVSVALRKESVDRNCKQSGNNSRRMVALRKESVDRNSASLALDALLAASLSARRAWIEIGGIDDVNSMVGVALRKESVDRNTERHTMVDNRAKSLSARRAWIEMPRVARLKRLNCVALRKESVDRNSEIREIHQRQWVALRKESVDRNHIRPYADTYVSGRSPQGERG